MTADDYAAEVSAAMTKARTIAMWLADAVAKRDLDGACEAGVQLFMLYELAMQCLTKTIGAVVKEAGINERPGKKDSRDSAA